MDEDDDDGLGAGATLTGGGALEDAGAAEELATEVPEGTMLVLRGWHRFLSFLFEVAALASSGCRTGSGAAARTLARAACW